MDTETISEMPTGEEITRVVSFADNFGRRSGLDRRQCSLDFRDDRRFGSPRRVLPERRKELDRRNGEDRRKQRRAEKDPFWLGDLDDLSQLDNRGKPVCIVGPDRRNGRNRRCGVDRRDFLVL